MGGIGVCQLTVPSLRLGLPTAPLLCVCECGTHIGTIVRWAAHRRPVLLPHGVPMHALHRAISCTTPCSFQLHRKHRSGLVHSGGSRTGYEMVSKLMLRSYGVRLLAAALVPPALVHVSSQIVPQARSLALYLITYWTTTVRWISFPCSCVR